MLLQESSVEMIEYRLALVLPHSDKVLAIIDADGEYSLPSIGIPRWARPAEQLQSAIRMTWKLHVLILGFLASVDDCSMCAIAEILISQSAADLKVVSVPQLPDTALAEQERAQLQSILAGGSIVDGFSSRLGWIDEAISWLESETGKRISSKHAIEQYNAGGGFALVRFHMEDDTHYWLKGTAAPNAHEFSITILLSRLCGDCLPEFVSTKPSWNAWLMSERAEQAAEIPTQSSELFTFLKDAVECMATLQRKTRAGSLDLLRAGAFDQRILVFQQHTAELFDFLEEAMGRQTSTTVPPIHTSRLQEIRTIFELLCQRLERLNICDTVVHGDLNRCNILAGAGHCHFIDWSETYLGNPLISLQHLLLLNTTRNPEVHSSINSALQEQYLDAWGDPSDVDAFREAFAYAPMLAIVSTLYGRGDWLGSPQRNDPHRQSYARSLARHMDRAARETQLLELLCL